jgi:titin
LANTGSPATSQLIGSLVNGGRYSFRVAAINAIGSGATSASGGVLVPWAAPGQVTGLRVAGFPRPTRVTLAWGPPVSNGGLPIVGYQVRVQRANGQPLLGWTQVSPGTRWLVVGSLTRGVVYLADVRAANSRAYGPLRRITFRVP